MVGDNKKIQNNFLDFKCNPYPGDPITNTPTYVLQITKLKIDAVRGLIIFCVPEFTVVFPNY